MPRPVLLLGFLAGVIVGTGVLHAQEQEHGFTPAARLGRVHFPTSCRPQAQRRFERGVALLHSFWYEEAGRAFEDVVAADSGCAMGYWGIAMSRLHPLWEPPTGPDYVAGLAAARRAQAASRPGSAERLWADAIASYYAGYDSLDHRTRMASWERAMRDLVAGRPSDEEARTFLALALIANGQLDARDTTYARQREAEHILEPLFRRHPDHPGLAHYLIHACDSPSLARDGVRAADRYASIAPAVPHAQHMPSHIYVRVGQWGRVVAANRRSAEAGARFEREERMPGLWDEHAHALDYLVYGYLQLGQVGPARDIVRQVSAVTRTVPGNSLKTDYALAAIPARFALEREDWAAAAGLPVRPAPAWRGAEAITHFARALGAARAGRLPEARAEVDTLGILEETLAAQGGPQMYWSGQVGIQRLAAGAWVAWVRGDTSAALNDASRAADLEDATGKHPVTPGPVLPARELFADLLLAAGRRDEANAQYRNVLRRQPGRARSLAGLRAAG